MKEIVDIIRLWRLRPNEQLALATLVRSRGSSYRRPGARMLISTDGTTAGSLSGGCLEEEVVVCAREVIRTARAKLMSFDTRRRFGCNGAIEIFVERAQGDFLRDLAQQLEERRTCRIATVFAGAGDNDGTRIVNSEADLPSGAFVQEIDPPIQLVIFGAGPDNDALRSFAETLGWTPLEFEEAAAFPANLDPRTAAIVKSHNYARDFAALRHLLQLKLRYVGLMGPRQRRDQLLHALLDEGTRFTAELFAPAGLEVGAETPEEIALAIVSEIQTVFAGGRRESLRDSKLPIHHESSDESRGDRSRSRKLVALR